MLVVLVVFVFLHSLRLTIIPTLAVPVSILGALVGMLVFGFSINMLTLFGMILAIGLVVDDAIVVVENTERNMVQFGLSPKDAAKRAMDEVSGPVIAVVLVLNAVFIPVAFLGGITGALYKQFAVTIAISVVFSGHRRPDAVAGPRRDTDQGEARREEGLLQVVRRHASIASPTAT